MMSDVELIQQFVKDSLRGREALLSNPALYAQQVCNNNELISKKEGRLLVVKLTKGEPPQFRAKHNSSYWVSVNQVLAHYGLLWDGDVDASKFSAFSYLKPPNGYRLHCTQSVSLWRAWWKYRQKIVNTTIPKELWIRNDQKWYPIKDLMFSNELIFVQTLGSEICIHSNDLVVWLEKLPDPNSAVAEPARTSSHSTN